jgi:adenylate cyclase
MDIPAMNTLFDLLRELIEAEKDPRDHESEIYDRFGQTLAILVADSVGMTKTTDHHGIIHFLSCVMQARDKSLPILESHGGFGVRYLADNFIAMFDSPQAAVDAALALQRDFQDHPIKINGQTNFELCIGVGYGKLLYSSTLEGYYGSEMNLTSKLGEDLARGKETLITQAAFDALSEQSKSEFFRIDPRDDGISVPIYRLNTRSR